MAKRYFITGTDTGVGKTYIALKLLADFAGENVVSGYIKPFQTGCRNVDGMLASPDVGEVKGQLGPNVECHMLYAFELPACPLLAADEADVTIDFQKAVEWTKRIADNYEMVVVEGAGGLMVPLTSQETVLDFAAELAYRVILVAENRLGCINHSLLSIRALESRGLEIEALVLNDLDPMDENIVKDINDEMIRAFAPSVRIIGVEHGGGLNL